MRTTTLLLALLTLPLLACANALGTHAAIGTMASTAIVATAPLVPTVCRQELAACTDAPCVERVGASCMEAAEAFEATVVAVRAYVDGVRLAAIADEGVVAMLVPAVRSLSVAWAGLAVLLARHGIALPTLPLDAVLGGDR